MWNLFQLKALCCWLPSFLLLIWAFIKRLLCWFSLKGRLLTHIFIHPMHRLGYLSLNGLSSNLLPWCWCQAFHDQALVVSRVAQGTRKGTKRANPRHHLLSGRDRFWTVFWSTLFCWAWEINISKLLWSLYFNYFNALVCRVKKNSKWLGCPWFIASQFSFCLDMLRYWLPPLGMWGGLDSGFSRPSDTKSMLKASVWCDAEPFMVILFDFGEIFGKKKQVC